jgi:hypothetical protein
LVILLCVWVTIEGVWIGDSIYWAPIHSRLVTTLYRSLAHTNYCPQSITVSTSLFLTTDFNTRTLRTSLNYSRYHRWSFFRTAGLSTEHSCDQVFYAKPPVQNWLCPLLITSRYGPCRNIPFPAVIIFLCACSLPRECVYRAVTQKWSLFTESPLSNGSIRHNKLYEYDIMLEIFIVSSMSILIYTI